jgi:hypothetical protein
LLKKLDSAAFGAKALTENPDSIAALEAVPFQTNRRSTFFPQPLPPRPSPSFSLAIEEAGGRGIKN